MRKEVYIYLFLLLVTLAVYSQVRDYQFVNFDDPDYVSDNLHVRAGLSSEGLVWAFTSSYAANWFPLTWLSHMLDCQFFGLRSGRHHLTNVLLHALSTLLLFAVLQRMTGSVWCSAFVAFLFALHPLHVESVAWVAERKDVLSAFFWFLALWNYARYVERPGSVRYLRVLLAFCCGLMAKPMIVTLPLVLLLLDVWPLKRLAFKEKVPLFALSLAASVVTYVVQQRGGAVMSIESIPISTRLGNAAISCVTYILQMFWPSGLAVFYPYPAELPVWQVVAATLAVGGVSVLALRFIRDHPYLAVGWFWYLVTLAPVIGLVQVGLQAHADRYTYIPSVGIAIVLAWGAADVLRRWPRAKLTIAAVAAAASAACVVFTWIQVQYWRNSITLFQHALEVTPDNYVAHNNLGLALRNRGQLDEAISHYREAARIRPQFLEARNNLSDAYLAQGRTEEAMPYIAEAIVLKPTSPGAHVNLGAALNKMGNVAESTAEYREALRLQPDNAEAHCGLGVVLSEQHQPEEALRQLLEAIRLKPDYADAHYNLGWQYAAMGRTDEAVAHFSETVRLQPGNAEAHFNLGTALGVQGKMNQAVQEFSAAVRLKPDYANAHFNLGSALANLGRWDEAIAQFSEVLRINPDFLAARDSLESALELQGKSPKP